MNEYNPPVKRWQFGGVAISVLFCGWCQDLNITESGRSANGQLLVLIPGIAVYFWPYGHVPAMALSAAPLKASYQRCFPRRLRLHGNNIYPAAPVKYIGGGGRFEPQGRRGVLPSLATIIVERLFDGVVMLMHFYQSIRARKLTGGAGVAAGSASSRSPFGAAWCSSAVLVFLLAAMFPAQRTFLAWSPPRRPGPLSPARARDGIPFLGGSNRCALRRIPDGLRYSVVFCCWRPASIGS